MATTPVGPIVLSSTIGRFPARVISTGPGAARRLASPLSRPSRRPLVGLLTRQRQPTVELRFWNALEGTEIGARQPRGLEIPQQSGPLASRFVRLPLGFASLLVGRAGRLALLDHALFAQGAATLHFLTRLFAMLLAQLAGRLAVQIETGGGMDQRLQVGRSTGVAAQEGRQHRLREDAGRARLDIRLDAQLQRLGSPAEQGREKLRQLLGALRRRQGSGCNLLLARSSCFGLSRGGSPGRDRKSVV
jgi:hypothetical protein